MVYKKSTLSKKGYFTEIYTCMNKIYKLIYEGEIVYIGRTQATLTERWNKGYKSIPFYKECEIKLIEETDDVSRERYWISYYKSIGTNLLNKNNGDGLDFQQYQKNYYRDNKRHLQYLKDYYQKNKMALKN